MTDATLERGSESITLPLLGEGAGEPLVATDVGKPEAGPSNRGTLNPRWSDQWSQLENIRLAIRFTDSNAYDTAIKLADLIKSHSGGTNLVLNIGLSEFPSDMVVAPAGEQDSALSLAYDPGGTDWVDAELTLTRVNQTLGDATQDAQTPTASGSGPITLSDGTTTLELTSDIVVDRSIGRPNSVIRRSTGTRPNYVDHRKRANDAFDIGFQFTDSADTKASDLRDMVGQQLGRSALTLDFQGIYGLGSFDVVPEGSGALRLVRPSAEAGTVIVPTLSLRRVLA